MYNKGNKSSSIMNLIKTCILIFWSLIFIYPSFWHLFIGPTLNRYSNLYMSSEDYQSITFPFSDLIHSFKFPIHNNAVKGKVDKLQKLLATNPNVNFKDWNGIYPLEYACCFNHAYLAKVLLDNGAKPTLCTSYNPLNCTIKRRNYSLLEVLSNHKADWNKKGKKEKHTPLQLAVKQQNVKSIEIALKHKASLSKNIAYEYFTPLQKAFIKQDAKAIKVELRNHLKQGQDSVRAKTILDLAIITQNLDVIATLINGGAPTENHITPKSPLIHSYLKLYNESGDAMQALEFIKSQISLSRNNSGTNWKYMPELPITTDVVYPEKPQ